MIIAVNSTVDPGYPCPVVITSSDAKVTRIDNVHLFNYVEVKPAGVVPYSVAFEPSAGSETIVQSGVGSPDALVSLGFYMNVGYVTAACYEQD